MRLQLPTRRWEALGYKPSRWSLEYVHKRDERFVAGVTCRQCGKTHTGAIELDRMMTEPPDDFGRPPSVAILAPTYEKAELLVDRYINFINNALGEQYFKSNKNKHKLWLPHNGAELLWLSATDPESVVGYTLSGLITDESQFIPDTVIEKLFPGLLARKAEVRAFGTPDITPDQRWFRSMWKRGQEGEEGYFSYTLSCYENPWMDAEDILLAKTNMPEREFNMLMLGLWVDEEGNFFRNINMALLPEEPKYNSGRRHVMAVDFAMQEDFNVVMIGEPSTRRVIHMERWNRGDLADTYDRIHGLWDRFGQPNAIVDATGMGEPMAWELRDRGMRVREMKITPANKLSMLGRLAGDIEHRRIGFPDWPMLVSELKGFVFARTPSGKLTAKAASGYHDDCVTALMLINEGMRRGGPGRDQTSYLDKAQGFLERLRERNGR